MTVKTTGLSGEIEIDDTRWLCADGKLSRKTRSVRLCDHRSLRSYPWYRLLRTYALLPLAVS